MTITLVVGYTLVGYCCYIAMPDHLPLGVQAVGSLLWPLTLITSIFRQLFK